MKTTALRYYISSIRTILSGIKNPGVILPLLFKRSEGYAARLQLKNGLIFLVRNLMDVWIVKETCLDRHYERASLPLQDGWTVVDVGAALGDYAVWAACQVPAGRIIAVEPWPPSISLLRSNLEKNRVYNAEIYAGALSGSNGIARLSFQANRAVQNTTAAQSQTQHSIEVKTLTLASLFEQFDVSKCDYLKMDCEGGEYDILFSTTPQTLACVQRLCMEIHDGVNGHNRHEMVAYLEGLGYRTRITPNPVHKNLAYLFADKSTT